MLRVLALFSALLAATAVGAQPTPASARVDARAIGIFQSDWVLMNWALKYYDRDRDIMLSPPEAEAAANEFRRIADADQDGRVTVLEYRRAREFILARY